MEKEVRRVNTRLYLEYLKFKDDMLRKSQEEVFKSRYRIDVFLNLYEIMVEKTEELPREILARLEKQEGPLERLYEGWMKKEDSVYQELKDYVEKELFLLLDQRKAG